MNKGLVGDIGRNCLYDGPGIRTTVFFKGCPLRCPWCHNPEFISPKPEISYYSERCIGCGDCVDSCPEKAIVQEKPIRVDRTLCTGCGLCEKNCPTKALQLVGKRYSEEELEELVLRDHLFYESSGGGVTLSGGEATMQLSFIGPFLQRLKAKGVHTAIETNGFWIWDEFAASCLDYLDLILFDVKIADPANHKNSTGADNTIILANLKKLVALWPASVIARIPLVPGYTADKENIKRIAALFRDFGVRRCSLLPYHPFGVSKAENVGRVVQSSMPQKKMHQTEVESWEHYFSGIELVKP